MQRGPSPSQRISAASGSFRTSASPSTSLRTSNAPSGSQSTSYSTSAAAAPSTSYQASTSPYSRYRSVAPPPLAPLSTRYEDARYAAPPPPTPVTRLVTFRDVTLYNVCRFVILLNALVVVGVSLYLLVVIAQRDDSYKWDIAYPVALFAAQCVAVVGYIRTIKECQFFFFTFNMVLAVFSWVMLANELDTHTPYLDKVRYFMIGLRIVDPIFINIFVGVTIWCPCEQAINPT